MVLLGIIKRELKMKKLNKTQVKKVIEQIKKQVEQGKLRVNCYRAIKEFLLKRQDKIYHYRDNIYLIDNRWLYDITTPMNIEPLPNTMGFCGFWEGNDDTYHYWLQSKKELVQYGITYEQFKNFKSINWFTMNGQLYINNQYYKKIL